MVRSHYCRKCPTKPKAHHWMFKPQGSPDVDIATCKYCGKKRKFHHRYRYDPTSKGDVHTRVVINPSSPHIVASEAVSGRS